MYAEFVITSLVIDELARQIPGIAEARLPLGEMLRIYKGTPPTHNSLEYGNPGQKPRCLANEYVVGGVCAVTFTGDQHQTWQMPEMAQYELSHIYQGTDFVLIHRMNKRQMIEPYSFDQHWELYSLNGAVNFQVPLGSAQLKWVQVGKSLLKGWQPVIKNFGNKKIVEVSVIGRIIKDDPNWLIKRLIPWTVYATVGGSLGVFDTRGEVVNFVNWLQSARKWQSQPVQAYLGKLSYVFNVVQAEGYGVIRE